jgi:hypothetical protein
MHSVITLIASLVITSNASWRAASGSASPNAGQRMQSAFALSAHAGAQ